MTGLFEPMTFRRGPAMKNRMMLAPLTNQQSHADGTLSDDEFKWLVKRAEGGFGLTMTCAAHVQRVGQGFPGQLGIWDDKHIPGLTRLAAAIKANGSRSSVQLHHAGLRSPKDLIGEAPVAPSDDAESGARALSLAEVERLRDDFIAAALRAENAGFDGVELHGAHGYILCAFNSPGTNRREDHYGGSPENRARLLSEIIDGVRARCRTDFTLGVRLSPERFGLKLGEQRDLAEKLLREGRIDYLDMSLWDVFKDPNEEEFRHRKLMDWFTELPRDGVRLGVAGKIMTPKDAQHCLNEGCDYVLIGRGAILHHDWPKLAENVDFEPIARPVSRAWLRNEGLSDSFISYMNNWKGFVAEDDLAIAAAE